MTNYTSPEEGYIQQRYKELSVLRDRYRDRAYDYAQVTLPYIMPDTEGSEGRDTSSEEFQHDYNTEGAKLTNSLANTYMETLFPSGRSYIKLDLSEEQIQEVEQTGSSKADIEAQFAQVERLFRKRFSAINARPTLLDGIKQLIITGNTVFHLTGTGKLVSYAIDEYVVLRALDGSLLELITEDKKSVMTLPDDLREQVMYKLQLEADDPEDIKDTVSLYTCIKRDPSNPKYWLISQAVDSFSLDTDLRYSEEDLPWLVCVWNRTRREMYGRGLVEEHYGSFWTLSILTEALAIGCVTMADVKFLVKPGSYVDIQELNGSPSGSYHYGDPDDVNAITSDKQRDIVMIKDVIETYKRHLGEVFMYLPSTMRDAERVTAEENRLRAVSLEKAHGGVYSALSDSLQKPLATLILAGMGLGGLEKQGVQIQITTGIDALSRGSENDKINHWLADLQGIQAIPPDILAVFDVEAFAKVTAAGRDVDFTKFILTNEQAAAKLDAMAQRQAAAQAQARGPEQPQQPQATQF
jgi:hypothetical protein